MDNRSAVQRPGGRRRENAYQAGKCDEPERYADPPHAVPQRVDRDGYRQHLGDDHRRAAVPASSPQGMTRRTESAAGKSRKATEQPGNRRIERTVSGQLIHRHANGEGDESRRFDPSDDDGGQQRPAISSPSGRARDHEVSVATRIRADTVPDRPADTVPSRRFVPMPCPADPPYRAHLPGGARRPTASRGSTERSETPTSAAIIATTGRRRARWRPAATCAG
ncbi:hypothetical protein Acel_0563 [Acidothermus cellulolyticus 11B]|uniref:Uncharacterized protein n=1 Tax=Acidothermus cellulolyticus (strain ATCC 43068 / DSM 8971 / 11B) TaxID=351607 RepID=A0LSC6_ACIC1|nr:hypothetical protein Acel_0563 [Acidothermus cellulolyticus 11B]